MTSVADLEEAIAQAHNRLHAGDVDGCHELLHVALGSGYVPVDESRRLTGTPVAEFDRRFRELCLETGVRAAFVAADKQRLVSGGDAEIDSVLNRLVAGPNRAQRRAKR